MKWSYPVVALAAVVLGASSAAAQTPAAQTPKPDAAPTVISWFAGATTGIAIAHRVGGEISGEAGARVWRNLDASLEIGWLSDAANGKRTRLATPLTDYLTQTPACRRARTSPCPPSTVSSTGDGCSRASALQAVHAAGHRYRSGLSAHQIQPRRFGYHRLNRSVRTDAGHRSRRPHHPLRVEPRRGRARARTENGTAKPAIA